MVVRNNIVWLSVQELLMKVHPDFREALENTISKGRTRHQHEGLTSWQYEKADGEILINYSTIPAATLAKYDLPAPDQLAKQHLEQFIKPAAKAYDYYLAKPEVYEIATELSETAAWMLFLASVSRSQAAAMGYESVDLLYEDALALMAAKEWSKWKCNNIQVLKRKLKPFNKLFKKPLSGKYTDQDLHPVLDSLITKKIGNSNSRKITEEQQALMIQIYSEENAKPSIEQTYMMYSRKAQEMVQAYEASKGQHGWSPKSLVSYSTVKHFLMSKPVQQLIYEKRHGKQAYRGKYEIVTPREVASFANALWVLDATPVHRYYFDPETKGNYARLNVLPILDAHSWCVLGFYVSYKETAKAVKGALRVACNLSKYVPHQIQFDNSSAIKSYDAQKCLSALSPLCTPAAVGNSRSKVVEPFFRHFNEQVLKFRTGFTGSPVMGTKVDSKPNPEYLAHLVKTKQIVPVQQAIKEIHEDFAIWNHRVMKKYGKSPLERYRESIKNSLDRQRPYTETIEIDAFYEMPGELKTVKIIEQGKTVHRKTFIPQPYQYTNKGINPVINAEKMSFIVNDPEFNARHIGESFHIKYDPASPERAYLYKDEKPYHINNEHVAAVPFHKFHQAIADHEEGEMKALHAHLGDKVKQREIATKELTRFVDLTLENGTHTPAITENAFDKEVLDAAKAYQLEQLVNGEDFRIDAAPVKEAPKGIEKKLSRFDETPASKPEPTAGESKNKPIERW